MRCAQLLIVAEDKTADLHPQHVCLRALGSLRSENGRFRCCRMRAAWSTSILDSSVCGRAVFTDIYNSGYRKEIVKLFGFKCWKSSRKWKSKLNPLYFF